MRFLSVIKHFLPQAARALGSTVFYATVLCEREVSAEQVISCDPPENTNLLYFIIKALAFKMGARDHLAQCFLSFKQNLILKHVAKMNN